MKVGMLPVQDLTILVRLDLMVPEERRVAMAEFLVRANHGLARGKFEMDFTDGEIGYKSSVCAREAVALVTCPVIEEVLRSALVAVESHHSAIVSVIEERQTPAEAMEEIEAREPREHAPVEADACAAAEAWAQQEWAGCLPAEVQVCEGLTACLPAEVQVCEEQAACLPAEVQVRGEPAEPGSRGTGVVVGEVGAQGTRPGDVGSPGPRPGRVGARFRPALVGGDHGPVRTGAGRSHSGLPRPLCRFLVLGVLAVLLGMSAFAQGPVPPTPTEKDVVYGTAGGERLLLDVYHTGRSSSPRPAVVLVHGGAFRAGSKATYGGLATFLSRQGYVAFSVDYRLAPRHRYPAALDDVQRAVRWIRAHADRYGVDPARIGALGHSAGGYFTAMLAVRDTRDNGIPELQAWSSRVTCACDYFGVGDFMGDLGSAQGVQIIADFLGRTREEDPSLWREASPVAHASRKSAPLYIFHGTSDANVPYAQSVLLHAALQKAGAPVEFMTLEGARHGWPPRSEFGMRSEPAMLAFLRKHLRP